MAGAGASQRRSGPASWQSSNPVTVAIQSPTSPVTLAAPTMPAMNELIGLLIAILVIWFVLKLAKVAIRLILFVIAVLLIAGALYVFMR